MSDAVVTVLIVDDEPDMRALHKLFFESADFRVFEADNGKTALSMLEQEDSNIDVVVTDILMPEMNGYELCKAIKSDPHTASVIVVFVSSLSTLEEKAKGYGYGADDYFIKPLQPEELKLKINNLIDYRNRNETLQSEVRQSQSATMQIMNFYSDLGQVLEFFKSSITAKSFDELTKLMFETISTFGLKGIIQIIAPNGVTNYSEQGEVSPLEANVIELSRAKSRFFEFGARLIINYDNFSLLIKNMPVNDPERTGTLRDSLGILCNAMEARIDSILDQTINSQKTQITEDVKEVLDQAATTFGVIETRTNSALTELTNAVEDSFMSLGLSESQEDAIRDIIQRCMTSTNEAFGMSQVVYNMFEEIKSNLHTMQSLGKKAI